MRSKPTFPSNIRKLRSRESTGWKTCTIGVMGHRVRILQIFIDFFLTFAAIPEDRRNTKCVSLLPNSNSQLTNTLSQRLRPLSYSRAHVILIAFAIDTPDSLDNVQVKVRTLLQFLPPNQCQMIASQWIEEVRSTVGPDIPVILVGCKQDLRPPPNSSDYENYVHAARGEKIARDIGARAYKECSALRLEGVDDVFEVATRASMLMRVPPNGVQPHARRRSSVSGFDDEKGKSKWGCCVIC